MIHQNKTKLHQRLSVLQLNAGAVSISAVNRLAYLATAFHLINGGGYGEIAVEVYG